MTSRFGLQIRAATSADASAISELLQTGPQPIASKVLAERLEAIDPAAGVVLLALEWGPPSGIVVVNWFRTLTVDLSVGQITMLFVDPSERRRGLGRMLLKASSQAARSAGCGEMIIGATPCGTNLADFCEATGFTMSGALYTRPLRKKNSSSS